MSTMTLSQLHATNPYAGFPIHEWPEWVHGWNYDDPLFDTLVMKIKPSLIVEVGTWLGGSAMRMATSLKSAAINCKILCVDTWLGSLEFWNDQDDYDRYKALKLKHGYPTVYYQFLANIIHNGFQDHIIPFPQTSLTASAWILQRNIQADLIYIDASHEASDVTSDLHAWWRNVAENGIMFGDDWDSWIGVREAVTEFTKAHRIPYEIINGKWILHKQGSHSL